MIYACHMEYDCKRDELWSSFGWSILPEIGNLDFDDVVNTSWIRTNVTSKWGTLVLYLFPEDCLFYNIKDSTTLEVFALKT